MNTQNKIKRTLSDEASLIYLNDLLNSQTFKNRAVLIEKVCQQFNFYDPSGRMQRAGCAKALRELDKSGLIQLPAGRGSPSIPKQPQRLNNPVPLPVDVPSQVNEIESLELVLVSTDEQKKIWNELMIREHPLGAGLFVGRQLRYLIQSAQGYLGGIGFAAPALKLADREKWIGWDNEQRQTYLHLLVGMNRFLIRDGVNCPNLASKVLSMSIPIMLNDFEKRYGYRPLLLESFVDEAWSGTCYQAANWLKIGMTQGRGRQDSLKQARLSRKAIYVYPIEADFRQQMGLSAQAGLGALDIADGLESQQWAEQEFGQAPLGDTRLSKRLVMLAAIKGDSPGRAFADATQGDWAKTKAYYRFIDQPDDSAITMDNILTPHRQHTLQRMMGQKTVLCIQDGSEINYTNLDKCRGLGVLKANQTGAKTKGLVLNTTFTVTTSGLPLGILKSQCLAPEEKSEEESRKPGQIPIEEKKTFVWLQHHRDMVEVSKQLPQTRLVHVCDREADFFELFDEQRQNPSVDLLIRASHNRNIGQQEKKEQKPDKLFTAVRNSPIKSYIRVPIPQESSRTKKSKQKERKARPARLADMAIRFLPIEIPPPEYFKEKEPITLCVVHAQEIDPPAGADPVEWFLLTTMKISTASEAEQCLRWYTLRWRIEDWHRVLKSGCGIDDLAHKTANRLRRAIAINLVIAWRIMLMTLLGREAPDLPAELLFSDIELRTLTAFAKKKRNKTACHFG